MKYDSFGALMEAYNINALDGVNEPGKRERSDLDENEHRLFVTDCFDTYEGFGFIDTFQSPFEENEKYNGRKFTVLRRLTEEDADLECLPMWRIRFGKGKEFDAYPEEICFAENLSLTVVSEICSHGCNGICYKEGCPRGDWTKNAFGIKPSPKYGNDKNCPLLQFSVGKLPKNMLYKERTHITQDDTWMVCMLCKYSKKEGDTVSIADAYKEHCMDCVITTLRDAINEAEAEARSG